MEHHTQVHLDVDLVQEQEPDAIASWIAESGNIVEVKVPLTSVGGTQDPGDIASDYADAILVGELLAPLCNSIASRRIPHGYGLSVGFDCVVEDAMAFASLAHQLLTSRFVEGDLDFTGEFADIEEKLYFQQLDAAPHFPELADDYLANLMHASAPWEDQDILQQYQAQFPTWKYGFWRSFLSARLDFTLYCSISSWIAPPEVDVRDALSKYGIAQRDEPLLLKPGTLVSPTNLHPILACDECCVSIPYGHLREGLSCAAKLDIFGTGAEVVTKEEDWLVSPEGDVTVFRTQRAQHILFTERLSGDNGAAYISRLDQDVSLLRRSLGVEIHTPCDWSLLDGDKFEMLCYDIARRCGWFDADSVRKMGQTNSRDGGRDLIALSKVRPGHPPVKWVIQCKYLGTKASLTGSMMHISDCIDQYSAGGFCVMTNALIDSTLHDKLESISNRRSNQYRTMSGLEIERFLQSHRDLLARFFPTEHAQASD